MLTRVDRVLLALPEQRAAAPCFERLLSAELVREERSRALAARASVLRLGESEVELLEPDGSGPVADFLRKRPRGGLFAAGFACAELEVLARRLGDHGVPLARDGARLLLLEEPGVTPGLRAVVGEDAPRRPAGLLRGLYEVTQLAHDHAPVTRATAAAFGLDASAFVPIRSDEFGYEGTLTLFHPDRLDRVEVVTPTDAARSMGRFFAKWGPCLYMCYGESDHTTELRDRLLEQAPDEWTGPRSGGPPDNLWIHPSALAGLLLGVSRTSVAWTWSGHPERVRPTPP